MGEKQQFACFGAAQLFALAEKLKSKRLTDKKPPLIHCIMNTVASNDCANAVLAVGAKPVMADCPDESADITAHAQALVLNMGTFSKDKAKAMLLSGKTANKLGIPVVIDPVGVHASSLRREFFEQLSGKVRASVIKGNYQEINAIAGTSERELDPARLALAAAEKYKCVCAVTGRKDHISDGNKTFCIENGSPQLAMVTGSGCMTGALMGAFSTVAESFTAALCAMLIMDLSGEIAAADMKGTASYRVRVMDLFSRLTEEFSEEQISRIIRISEVKE